MKKTKKTILTSALLSAAVAMQGEIITSPKALETNAPVYGPPQAFYRGNINNDLKTDIVDYIMLKSEILSNAETSYEKDLNEDGILDANDIKVFERFLFGKIPDLENVYPDDYDDNPSTYPIVTTPPYQTKYGPFPVETTVQTVYGPPAAYTHMKETTEPEIDEPEVTEPIVTTAPETFIPIETNTMLTIPQCVYGPPSAFMGEGDE